MWFLAFVLAFLLCATPSWAALDCDGVDDAFDGSTLSTYFTATDFTVALWVTGSGTSPTDSAFCTDVASHQHIIGNASATTTRIHVTRHSATEMCGIHRDTTPTTVAITGTHTDLTPAHVALVHTGGNLSFYLQGVLVGTPQASGNTAALTNTLRLCGSNGFAFLNGRIDQIALYNSAVSADEIAALASGHRPRLRRTMPSAEWLFDNCADGASGDTVVFRDHSGNSRTITGADGANNTGLTCRSSTILGRHGGIQ